MTAIPPRAPLNGFSLIEMVIAIGIVSFALVATLGLLQKGLFTFRDSMNSAVASQIGQRMINSAEQADFTGLSTATNYFDEQGHLLPANSTTFIYQAWTTTNTTILPGSSLAQTGVNPNLITATVFVAYNPGHLKITGAITPGVIMMIYSTQIAGNK